MTDTMYPFTSGRDYRPQSAASLPPNAVYARVIVMAPDFDTACGVLADLHLSRYEETLRGPTGSDGPAQAVEAYASDNITEPTAFLVVRVDPDQATPRVMVAEVRADGPHVIGRIRGTGQDVPNPVYRIVPDLDPMDPMDEIGLVGSVDEGPATADPGVQMPAFPAGALGYLTKARERRLTRGLADARGELEQVIASIERRRTSTDPRVSFGRDSGKLLALSRQLAELAGDAAVVEVVLQSGT